MNIDKQIKKGITKGDILLIVSVCLISAALFLLPFMGNKGALKAEIYLSGEKIQEIILSEVTDSYTLKVGGCELLIENDGVSFISSGCSDKLCVKKGKLKRQGDAMACVPEKVVVNLKSLKGTSPDGVTY